MSQRESSDMNATEDRRAAADLLPLVYDELRALAAAKLANEVPNHSLDATALVHEAFLRLNGKSSFASTSHFFRAAAQSIRRVLVDHARARLAEKRGGGWNRAPANDLAALQRDAELLELDEAMNRLADEDQLAARVVELHHFVGLPHDQVAETLGTTVYQARLKWTYARAWLKAELG